MTQKPGKGRGYQKRNWSSSRRLDSRRAMTCNRFKDKIGFKGQPYVVVATPASGGPEQQIGWQNESSGGLALMINEPPTWPAFKANSARVVPACPNCGAALSHENQMHSSGRCGECLGAQ